MLISIIVPVYNAEKYLRRCIDSILAQTYKDFELILIDDGSSDLSGAICDQYAAAHHRVKTLHQTNAGVSAARNVGINVAIGKYVCFVDADDAIEQTYLDNFLELALSTSPQLVIQGEKIVYKNRVEAITFKQRKSDNLSTALTESILTFRGPYCKLYLRDIISSNNIKFPEGMQFGEDSIFYLQYLLHCKSISISDKSAYLYTANSEGGLCKQPIAPLEYLSFLELNSSIISKIENQIHRKFTHSVHFNIIHLKMLLYHSFKNYKGNQYWSFLRKLKKSPLWLHIHHYSLSKLDFLFLFSCKIILKTLVH